MPPLVWDRHQDVMIWFLWQMTYDFDFFKEECNICFKSLTEYTLAYKSIHIFSVNSDATLGLRQASRCNDMDFVADDLWLWLSPASWSGDLNNWHCSIGLHGWLTGWAACTYRVNHKWHSVSNLMGHPYTATTTMNRCWPVNETK